MYNIKYSLLTTVVYPYIEKHNFIRSYCFNAMLARINPSAPTQLLFLHPISRQSQTACPSFNQPPSVPNKCVLSHKMLPNLFFKMTDRCITINSCYKLLINYSLHSFTRLVLQNILLCFTINQLCLLHIKCYLK